ncbi:MAG: calcium-binding protein, partial [Thermosynechococcaceae cyanobacterium]
LYSDGAYSGSNGQLSSTLGAGSYFAWIDTSSTNDNTNYTFNLSAIATPPTTPSNPGDSLNMALNIGNLSAPKTYQDFVGTVDRTDVYQFNLTQTSDVSLTLSGLTDNANIRLISDLNNNRIVDSGETLYSDGAYSGSNGQLSSTLGAGSYFAWIDTSSTNDNTNYIFGLSAIVNTPSNSDDYILGTWEDQTINGLAGNDFIDGASGNDYLIGGLGNDTLMGSDGNDILRDSSGDDILDGGDGNDNLYAGAGNDILRGGAGNDIYYLSYVATDLTNDTIVEAANAGIDTAYSIFTVNSLAANVENLTLFGSSAINGTGNNLNNVIYGNSANNVLNGAAGNDYLIGGLGNDILRDGVGNDTLDGGDGNDNLYAGVGNDILRGGAGNDIYYLSYVATDLTNDTIVEAANAGIDTAYSIFTVNSLAANVENLTLFGSSAINGTGNNLNNIIYGNSANNVLNGAAGNDYLIGGLGNDTLIGANTVTFGVGEIDTLQGGTGSDRFILASSTRVFYDDGNSASAGLGDYAVISDFVASTDIIQLKSGLSYNFGSVSGPVGTNSSGIYIDNDGVGGLSGRDELIGVIKNTQLSGSINAAIPGFTFV